MERASESFWNDCGVITLADIAGKIEDISLEAKEALVETLAVYLTKTNRIACSFQDQGDLDIGDRCVSAFPESVVVCLLQALMLGSLEARQRQLQMKELHPDTASTFVSKCASDRALKFGSLVIKTTPDEKLNPDTAITIITRVCFWVLSIIPKRHRLHYEISRHKEYNGINVAFVIDSSRSIWNPNFKTQLEFIKHLVEKFVVSKNNTHVAALTFSDKVVQQFHFNAVQDKDRILSQLTAIRQDDGYHTLTHTALEATMTDLFAQETGARDNVPHIAIVLTDGKATYGAATLQAADDVKQSGIKILTVGIGNQVDDEELKAVASPPASNNYFKIKNFDDLKGIKWQQLIALQACEVIEKTTTASPQTTTTTATSTTIKVTTTTTTPQPPPTTTTTTTTTKPTQTTTMRSTTSACQGKQADIVFVIDSSASIWPEDFKTQLSFISDVISHFDVEGGKTQTLLNDVMSVKNGARPQTAARIAVLITDGRSARPDLTFSAAKDVHTDGIYMFAIVPGDQPKCTSAFEAEIMFGIYGIGGESRLQVTEFIKMIGDSVGVSTNVKIGLVESCNKADIALQKFTKDNQFAPAVEDAMQTSAYSLVSRVRLGFGRSATKANRFAIFLIAGPINDFDETKADLLRLKYSTRSIVVGVGSSVDRSQLKDLASYRDKHTPDLSHVFPVEKAENLVNIVRKVLNLMCNDSQ
ncbi:MATN1-like protein [Mya arenaria]|uniref:MATN1-like protein n=1 Tax=Mya arenaria TaxID=6604 RepID=A0ABY7DI80_MYAAR|nr:MATN1-like protein [Mya arenaria]